MRFLYVALDFYSNANATQIVLHYISLFFLHISVDSGSYLIKDYEITFSKNYNYDSKKK